VNEGHEKITISLRTEITVHDFMSIAIKKNNMIYVAAFISILQNAVLNRHNQRLKTVGFLNTVRC